MADSIADLGLEQAFKYVHHHIVPSALLLSRDVVLVLVNGAAAVSEALSNFREFKLQLQRVPSGPPPTLRRCKLTSA